MKFSDKQCNDNILIVTIKKR